MLERHTLHRQRRAQVAHRIAALHQPAQETPQARRCALHRVGGPDPPITAHSQTIERTRNHKESEVRCQSAQYRHRGKMKHAADQRNLAPESVGQRSKQERTHWPHRQRQCQRVHDRVLVNAVLRGNRIE